MTIIVRRATRDEILPLRHAVLRPGKPLAAAMWERDDESTHLGAWDGDELVGCATVTEQEDAWQLRGMAVDPDHQGAGIGRAVLEAAVEVVRQAGGTEIRANARTTALPFYEAMGFTTEGEEFVTEATGLPHKRIVRPLAAGSRP